MLIEYIRVALRHAKYEILQDDGNYYGEIPECNGVYVNAATLETCREKLREVLEEWILFRIYRNLSVPRIDGTELVINGVSYASLVDPKKKWRFKSLYNGFWADQEGETDIAENHDDYIYGPLDQPHGSFPGGIFSLTRDTSSANDFESSPSEGKSRKK